MNVIPNPQEPRQFVSSRISYVYFYAFEQQFGAGN